MDGLVVLIHACKYQNVHSKTFAEVLPPQIPESSVTSERSLHSGSIPDVHGTGKMVSNVLLESIAGVKAAMV